MRFRLLRPAVYVLFAAPLGVAYYGVFVAVFSPTSPLLPFISAVGGAVGSLAALFDLWDRFFPAKELRRETPPTHRTVDEYLNGRLRKFAEEERLFVRLSGNTEIKTRFTTESRDLAGIAEAVALHKGRFVLIGDPGAGKSTALRHLFLARLRDYQRSPAQSPLPVWINLGLSAAPVEAADMLHYWWDEKCFLPDVPEKYLEQDRLCLFLDGLNEMPLDSRENRAKSLRGFLKNHPDLPVIVTCRVRDYEDDKALNLDLSAVYVRPLHDAGIREFVHKRAARDRDEGKSWDAEALQTAIQSGDALGRLAQNPYNLVMLIEVYRDTGAIPADLNALYRLYLQAAYNTNTIERVKQGQKPLLRLSWPELESALKRLAFRMIVDGKGTAAELDWARHRIGRRALLDGLNMGVLLRDGETLRFYHQSLHGYFAIQPLSRRLQSPSRFERLTKNPIALIREIGDLGANATPAVEPLVAALRDSDQDVRRSAAEALEQIADQRAVEPLIAALRDPNAEVRSRAAFALGQIGDERAAKPLIAALHTAQGDVFTSTAFALERIGTSAVEPLITALRALDRDVRHSAVATLGRIGDVRAVEPLIAALRDPDGHVSSKAAEALGQMGAPAVEPLLAALHDPVEGMRRRAAYALGQIGDTRAVEPLIAALRDLDGVVRSNAASGLGKIGDARAFDPLMTLLSDSERGVRSSAAFALGQIGDARAFEPLIAALHDPEWEVRHSAAFALGQISDERAVEPLIVALHDSHGHVRLHAALALSKIGDARAVEPFIAALRDPEWGVRKIAVDALGQIGDARAVEPLIAVLRDPNYHIRSLTADALKRIDTPAARAALKRWEAEQRGSK